MIKNITPLVWEENNRSTPQQLFATCPILKTKSPYTILTCNGKVSMANQYSFASIEEGKAYYEQKRRKDIQNAIDIVERLK